MPLKFMVGHGMVGMMAKMKVQKKIQNLELQLAALKRLFIGKPNESIDEKNWRKVKAQVKRSRKATFRQMYGK